MIQPPLKDITCYIANEIPTWKHIKINEIACEYMSALLPCTEFINGIYSTVRSPPSFMSTLQKDHLFME